MDHVPVPDQRAAGDLRPGKAKVEALTDRRADGRPVERRDRPPDHPSECARVRVAVGGGRGDPGGDGAPVVEMGRHGGLDEARPARRQRLRVVEELERDVDLRGCKNARRFENLDEALAMVQRERTNEPGCSPGAQRAAQRCPTANSSSAAPCSSTMTPESRCASAHWSEVDGRSRCSPRSQIARTSAP